MREVFAWIAAVDTASEEGLDPVALAVESAAGWVSERTAAMFPVHATGQVGCIGAAAYWGHPLG
ncbi:hypothetical protein ACIPV2_08370 [Microbacterium sp. NPDC089987]|uniref:hypothetical protein n=1 Tax=Microbacterium sp. NPDC089987 TaxID=3364202 RepID=UPI00381467D8